MSADDTESRPSLRTWLLYGWAAIVVGILLMHVIWPQPGQDDVYWPWPVGLMPFPVAGALILDRRPGNGVGRTLTVVGVAAFMVFFTWWLTFAIYDHWLSPYVEALGNPPVLVSFGGIAVLLHLFPSGHPIGPRHRWVIIGMWTSISLGALNSLVDPAPLPVSLRENPFALPLGWAADLLGWAIAPVILLVPVGIGVLLHRRRVGDLVVRLQLRWFLAASVVAVLVFVAFVSPYGDTAEQSKSVSPVIDFLWSVILILAMFWSIPIAITIAVLRYRLFEIDRLVSRTVSYVLVVAVLAAVFAGLVVGIQTLLPAQGDLAVAASTLAAAALFNPLRKRIQSSVDHRFNRSKYDAEAEIDALSSRLREAHDRDEIAAGILGVIRTTMQPSTVGIWVRDD